MGTSRSTGLHLLAVREILTKGDGDHMDGGGLRLRIRGESAAWVLRYTSPNGRRREMGLGPVDRTGLVAAGKSVVAARELAQTARDQLRQSVDPIDARGRQARGRQGR